MNVIRQEYMREIQRRFHETYAWRYLSQVMRMEAITYGQPVITSEYIAALAEEELGDLPNYKTWLKERADERRTAQSKA